MSKSVGTTDIPRQDMKLDNNKKTVLLGTKQPTTKLKIFQWNAGGLSSTNMTELKRIITQNDADLLLINEANITAKMSSIIN